MSRQSRIEELGNPRRADNWNGDSTEPNIARYSQRAADNSKIAPRARKGEMRLFETGEMHLRSTSSPPRRSSAVDRHMVDDDS